MSIALQHTHTHSRNFVRRNIKPHTHCINETHTAAFLTQNVNVDGRSVKFQVWDTAGQERYKSLVSMYYRGTKAAVLVYDITDEKSFKGIRRWTKEIKEKGEGNVVVVLCGNKLDLAEDSRKVSTEEGKRFAEENGLMFIETSAKSGSNVNEMFKDIAKRLPEEERKMLKARLEAIRLQMEILDLENALSNREDRSLEARLASARTKLKSTGRSVDVEGRSASMLASLMTETSMKLGLKKRDQVSLESNSGKRGCC